MPSSRETTSFPLTTRSRRPSGPGRGAAGLCRAGIPRKRSKRVCSCGRARGASERNRTAQEPRPRSICMGKTPESWKLGQQKLFVPNGFNRVEPCRFHGRIDAENKTNGDRNQKRKEDGTRGNDGGPPRQPGDQLRDAKPHHHAQQPARKGDEHRFRSEEHTSELQSLAYLVCRLLLEKK